MNALGGFTGWLSARAGAVWSSPLVRSGIGLGGLNGAELALGLAAAILLARALGADGLGAYSLALAAVVLAGLPVELGLPSLVLREIAHGAGGEERAAGSVIAFAALAIAGMSVIIVPLVLTAGGALVSEPDGAAPVILKIALALIPVNALCNLLGGALAGRQRVVIGNVPQMLVRPGVFAVGIALAVVVAPEWLTPARAMVLQVVASVAALAFAALQFRRHFRDLRGAPLGPIAWRSWARATLHLGVANGLRLAGGQLLLLLTGVLSTVEDVGLLRIAQRGAAIASLAVSIAVMAIAPELARLNAAGERERLQRLLTRIARTTAAASASGVLLVFAAGHWVLGAFFGAGFVAAWPALMLLAAAELVRALLGPAAVLLTMLRHEGVTARGLCLSVAVSTAATAALAPALGATGAALGGFLGHALSAGLLWWRARRILGLDPSAFGKRPPST